MPFGFRVGVRGGAKEGSDDPGAPGGGTWHWRLVELGTEHSAAEPFMRPAMESNIQRAINEFVRSYGRGLDRAIKKGAAG